MMAEDDPPDYPDKTKDADVPYSPCRHLLKRIRDHEIAAYLISTRHFFFRESDSIRSSRKAQRRSSIDPGLSLPLVTPHEMTARTIKIGNISLSASEKDIIEFFSFSGEIEYVEMQSESERSQLAYVTFKDPQGAETAILLSGATIVDMCVTITAVENYQLPPEALERAKSAGQFSTGDSVVLKAEDVTSTMLAKGFVLGKDALSKAKEFDEKHSLTSNAAATMTSLDQKIGLSEKISVGTAVVNEKVKEVDNIFHVSETTKSALATAEQKVSSAGSVLMKNRYILTGTSWVTNAFNKVAKAAEDVSVMTKDKMEKAKEEKKVALARERSGMVNDYAQFHFEDEPLPGEPATVPVDSTNEGKRPGAI